MNPESIDMWREYVRMELGFIESLRRRWEVLGISLSTAATTKGKEKADEEIDPSEHISLGGLGEEVEEEEGQGNLRAKAMEIDPETGGLDGDEGAAARREIMQGAIVKSVMSSAAGGMCLTGSLVYLTMHVAICTLQRC